MKMHLALPIIMLAVAIAACGKKDDTAATTAATAVQPFPATNPYPYPNPNPNPNPYPGNDLASFCQSYGGQVSGSNCVVTRNYQNQSWYSISIGDFNTGVAVYSGERVSISLSGAARIYIGGYQYGTGSTSFVSNSQGYLTLQKYTSTYNVQQISVQTCYSAAGQRAYCN
jgi:hypothetical protein